MNLTLLEYLETERVIIEYCRRCKCNRIFPLYRAYRVDNGTYTLANVCGECKKFVSHVTNPVIEEDIVNVLTRYLGTNMMKNNPNCGLGG